MPRRARGPCAPRPCRRGPTGTPPRPRSCQSTRSSCCTRHTHTHTNAHTHRVRVTREAGLGGGVRAGASEGGGGGVRLAEKTVMRRPSWRSSKPRMLSGTCPRTRTHTHGRAASHASGRAACCEGAAARAGVPRTGRYTGKIERHTRRRQAAQRGARRAGGRAPRRLSAASGDASSCTTLTRRTCHEVAVAQGETGGGGERGEREGGGGRGHKDRDIHKDMYGERDSKRRHLSRQQESHARAGRRSVCACARAGLVGADDEAEAVDAEEPLRHVRPEAHAVGPPVRRTRHPHVVLRAGARRDTGVRRAGSRARMGHAGETGTWEALRGMCARTDTTGRERDTDEKGWRWQRHQRERQRDRERKRGREGEREGGRARGRESESERERDKMQQDESENTYVYSEITNDHHASHSVSQSRKTYTLKELTQIEMVQEAGLRLEEAVEREREFVSAGLWRGLEGSGLRSGTGRLCVEISRERSGPVGPGPVHTDYGPHVRRPAGRRPGRPAPCGSARAAGHGAPGLSALMRSVIRLGPCLAGGAGCSWTR